MKKTIILGISQCLLGEGVRFDGGHKKFPYATGMLAEYFQIEGICPEVESGMPVPRPTIRLTGDPDKPRVTEVLTPKNDHTERLTTFSDQRVKSLAHLSGFILKNKSPSCGMERVKVYQETPAQPLMGVGVFAKALIDAFPLLPVEEEGRLNDFLLRENFIERVFVYHRWQTLLKDGVTAKKLLAFHTEHKLTLLAHDQGIYRDLGKDVANLKDIDLDAFSKKYFTSFMQAM